MFSVLQSCGRLEQVLVVIVNMVQVILHDGPLGNLSQHLVHHGVRDVVPQQVQDETVSSTKLKILQSPGSDFAHQNRPGEVWDHDPGEPVDQADDGDSNEEEPPEPKDEEILLVEDVIIENAKVVASVDGSSGSTNTDVAGDLSREQFTHGVMAEVFSFWSHVLHRPDVVEGLLSVGEELVEQQGVCQQHGEEDHHKVHELTEPKVDVVLGVSHAEVQKVLADDSRITLSPQNVPDEPILQEVPPQ